MREHEIREGVEDAGYTADAIERILQQDPVVTIDRIDEYGQPWFNYNLIGPSGAIEEHTLTFTEEGTWILE